MYGKHFTSMYTGSMYGAGAVVFAVWGYVIAHVRHSDSSVELNSKALANILGEHVDKVDEAIDFLCKPDPSSRSKENDGARMVREGQFIFRVTNAAKFHEMKDDDARREYQRKWVKEKRLSTQKVDKKSTKIDRRQKSTQEEEEVEVEEKEEVKAIQQIQTSSLFPTAEKDVKKISSTKSQSEKPESNGNAFADWSDCNIEINRQQPIATGKILGICKRIAVAIPDTVERKKLFREFLSDTDSFIVSAGHPLALFESRIEKYRNSSVVLMKNGYDARKTYVRLHTFHIKAKPCLTPAEERQLLEVGNVMTKDEFYCACEAYGRDSHMAGKPMKVIDLCRDRGFHLARAGILGITPSGKLDPNSEAGIEAFVLGCEAMTNGTMRKMQ